MGETKSAQIRQEVAYTLSIILHIPLIIALVLTDTLLVCHASPCLKSGDEPEQSIQVGMAEGGSSGIYQLIGALDESVQSNIALQVDFMEA
jgi:hypothetical protein